MEGVQRAWRASLRGMRVSFTPSRRSELGARMRWSDELGAKKGDLERSHESELEGSGVVWSANRAFRALRASLRGQWGLRVHHHPRRDVTLVRWREVTRRLWSDLERE